MDDEGTPEKSREEQFEELDRTRCIGSASGKFNQVMEENKTRTDKRTFIGKTLAEMTPEERIDDLIFATAMFHKMLAIEKFELKASSAESVGGFWLG